MPSTPTDQTSPPEEFQRRCRPARSRAGLANVSPLGDLERLRLDEGEVLHGHGEAVLALLGRELDRTSDLVALEEAGRHLAGDRRGRDLRGAALTGRERKGVV